MANNEFSAAGFGLRLLFAIVLVFLTYNPSGWSYYHWLYASLSSVGPWVVLAGLMLLIGWVVYLRATLRSLGPLGLVLAVAVLGTLLWLIVDIGWLPGDSAVAITYSVLVLLSLLLAIGMSWSHVRRRLSGQVDMDDLDED